ncbi:MAG: DNA polymerase I [Patescibacteria group bacterium]|nr:DNA polymerase I [Patescibacteria group bacterium]
MKKKKFLIVDGHALLHRAYHALPSLTTQDGKMVNAVYGFFLIFLNALREFKPDYIGVCFDRPEPTFRHKKFNNYKAHRPKTPSEIKDQLPIVKEGLEKFNIPVMEKAGYEADDLIASIARELKSKHPNVEVLIATGDLDTLQLIDSQVKVITLRKGLTDTAIYDEMAVRERFGFSPSFVVDFKGLRGDPSDNIPGVSGIGEKTAQDLIIRYGHVEDIYKRLEKGGLKASDRVLKLLTEQKEQAFLSKDLAQSFDTLEIDYALGDFVLRGFDYNSAVDWFKKMEFRSLLNKIPQFKEQAGLFEVETKEKPKKEFSYTIINKKNFNAFLSKIKKQKEFVFDTETTNLNGELVGLSFCFGLNQVYYLPLSNHLDFKLWDDPKNILKQLSGVFSNLKINKIGHNLKYDYKILKRFGIEVSPLYFDTMIASWLISPEERNHSLDRLSFVLLSHEKIDKSQIFGKTKLFDLRRVKMTTVAEYSSEDAWSTYRLYQELDKKLKELKLWELAQKIEMPLTAVLAQMEEAGIKINKKLFAKYNQEVGDELKELEKRAYKIIGTKFNLNSPMQLRQILFTTLNIDSTRIKKTKTGLSTAASELEKMRGAHQIVDLILRHRELSKLKNTYLDAIPKLVDKNDLVHTNFNQTATATGRLSSSDPNLQNIPTRTSLGNKIRYGFIADKGCKLIVADYSQIELRVVAHLAQEENMIKEFKAGRDIHTATAALVYKVSLGQVSKTMRRTAKTVNFGVVYGISPYGLAKSLGVTQAYARRFIEKYFQLFPRLKDYTKKTIEQAQKLNYVETLFGRRRYLKDIGSQLSDLRSAAERAAVNMPVQGTAADIVKLGMLKINHDAKIKFPNLKMLLQVHDELIFEIAANEAQKASQWVKQELEEIVKLDVPMVADVKIVNSWGEAK